MRCSRFGHVSCSVRCVYRVKALSVVVCVLCVLCVLCVVCCVCCVLCVVFHVASWCVFVGSVASLCGLRWGVFFVVRVACFVCVVY